MTISEDDIGTLLKGANRLGAAGLFVVLVIVGIPALYLHNQHEADIKAQEVYNLEQQVLQAERDKFYADQFAATPEAAEQQKAIYDQQKTKAELRLRSIRGD